MDPARAVSSLPVRESGHSPPDPPDRVKRDRSGLAFGPLDAATVHLCVDMQNLFAPGAPWATPWFTRVLPSIVAIVERHAAHTIFTRFMPPSRPEDAQGAWRRYFHAWAALTRDRIDPVLLELPPALSAHVPPALLCDKAHYSPFHGTGLATQLRERGVRALVVTGTETDVCVLAAVLDAVDAGFRVVIASDALCSSNDATHDASMTLYHERFSHQVEVADTEAVLAAWPAAGRTPG